MPPVNMLVAERAMFVLALSRERRWPAFGGGGPSWVEVRATNRFSRIFELCLVMSQGPR